MRNAHIVDVRFMKSGSKVLLTLAVGMVAEKIRSLGIYEPIRNLTHSRIVQSVHQIRPVAPIRVVELRHDPLVGPARKPVEDLKLHVRRSRPIRRAAYEGFPHALTKWPAFPDQPSSTLQLIHAEFKFYHAIGHLVRRQEDRLCVGSHRSDHRRPSVQHAHQLLDGKLEIVFRRIGKVEGREFRVVVRIGTAIGDGLEVSLAAIDSREKQHRVLP